MSTQDEIRENQAARIRWLLARADRRTYFEFTMKYVPEHPFPDENPAEETASADDV